MNKRKRRFPDGLLVLLLFGIFAACILAVLLTGADAYKRLTLRDEQAFDARTAARYLETRLHQADERNGIFPGTFDRKEEGRESYPVLFLEEKVEETSYYTRVYCYDGYLRELFCQAENEMEPEDGEKILPLRQVEFQLTKEGLLLAVLTGTDGKKQQVYYQIRSELEEEV